MLSHVRKTFAGQRLSKRRTSGQATEGLEKEVKKRKEILVKRKGTRKVHDKYFETGFIKKKKKKIIIDII